MLAPKWHFPPFIHGYVAQDPTQSEFFNDERIGGLDQALIREAIQNAIDAHAPSQPPVEVRIALKQVPPSEYRVFLAGLEPHLHVAMEKAPSLDKDMQFLIIEDFNTRGLEGDPKTPYLDAPTPGQDFYYFWRNIGRTGKKSNDLGRWGLGKTVFPALSALNSFFGLTRRQGDPSSLLMGQAVLKHHTVAGQHHTPYGYFGMIEGEFALPITDDTIIDHFTRIFGLQRGAKPGFSIVLPLKSESNEVNSMKRLVVGAVAQYFYPIMTETLVLKYSNEKRIKPETIESGIERLADHLEADKKAQLLGFIRLLRWSMSLPEPQFIRLDEPDRKKAPSWDKYLRPETVSEARARFEAEGRVAFRVGMKVQEKSSKRVDVGWFTVLIERDETLKKPSSLFLRNGICLLDIRGHSIKGIRGMVIVDDSVLGRMLGDAENPAHTDWKKDSEHFSKYEHGPWSLTFVRSSLSKLVESLTAVTESQSLDLLSDVFYAAGKPTKDRARREPAPGSQFSPQGQSAGTPHIEPAAQAQPVRIRHLPAGGVVLDANPDYAGNRHIRVTARFAYDIRQGNPFGKYSPLDFDFSDRTHEIRVKDVKVIRFEQNVLQFDVTAEEFGLAVGGFDRNRDIVVRLEWEQR